MDANIKVLVDTAGCTEAEAQQALKEGSNNLNRALELLDAANREVIVFHFMFEQKGKAAEGKGYLTTIFDLSRDVVHYSDMVYPLGGENAEMLDINMPPTVFAKTLQNSKAQLSDRHKTASASNLSLIRAKLSSSFIRKAIDFHNKGQIDKINQLFGDVLKEVYGEQFTVQYYARSQSLGTIVPLIKPQESASSSRPDQAASKLFGKAPEPQHSMPPFDLEDIKSTSPQDQLPQIVLLTEAEISPFAGKPARDLLEGDEVIVKVKDGRDSARYFAELLGGSVGDELVPLVVPIVKINKLSETFVEAFVEFGPGIFGQFFIPPDVKVKMKTEGIEIYNPFQDEKSLFAEEKLGRQILWGLFSLVGAVMLLILVFILISVLVK